MNTDTRTDAEVIAASLDDLEEFGIIFERHYDAVFTYVARRIQRTEAADLTSAVFIKAIDVRRRYDVEKPDALPWLYGIAKNTIGDRMRRIRRSKRAHLAVQLDRPDTNPGEAADDRLVAAAVSEEVLAVLRTLTSGQREALLMSALEDLTYAEIAGIQGVSSMTVGSRLSRARRRFWEDIPDLEQKTDRIGGQTPEDRRA